VNVGTDRIRFEFFFWKNANRSLLFSIIMVDMRKSVHSSVMFIGL